MDTEMALLELEEHMQKSLDFSLHEFASIRTGKANPSMVEGMDIHVISYGMNMKLKQLASITTPEPRMIVVEPFDASTLKDIERGLRDNRLGLSPVTYGKLIRLHVPDLTQERRKELAKYLKEKNEEGKVRLRGHRRDAMEAAKKAQKAGAISEDDLKSMEESIQETTDKYVKEMEAHAVKKETELMHV